MRLRLFALLSIVAFCLVGCKKPEDQIVGTWQGKSELRMPPSGNAALDAQFSKAKTVVDFTLKLNPDKTYVESLTKVVIEGTWVYDGGRLTLTPTTINGEDPAKRRAEWEKMNSELEISMPIPEGAGGPQTATVSSDLSKITLRSNAGAVDLAKAAK